MEPDGLKHDPFVELPHADLVRPDRPRAVMMRPKAHAIAFTSAWLAPVMIATASDM
jgi:hypothetical protein